MGENRLKYYEIQEFPGERTGKSKKCASLDPNRRILAGSGLEAQDQAVSLESWATATEILPASADTRTLRSRPSVRATT
jgi:hypothetical protein